jgi:cell division protein FtsQ
VIADDGTVLEPYVARRFVNLPFVVGRGAQTRAKDLVAMLGRHAPMRRLVRASVLVAERRWNVLLRSGLEIKLPENGAEKAIERLLVLDHDKKLLSRDIVNVDLRLPDRVSVQLSDEAAKARADKIAEREKREKQEKRKGGHA